MRVVPHRNFEKDTARLKSSALRARILVVLETLVQADSLASSSLDVAKMQGYDDYYRIRVGQYRIGLQLRTSDVLLVRFAHRNEIYKVFP